MHFRSIEDNLNVFSKIIDLAKNYELNLVLAVDVKTDFISFMEFAKENIENINAFQVMGIEKIGFQGQKFADESLGIVKKLKKTFPKKEIYFDGGEDEETVPKIKEAGVDVFCVGHYLTQAQDFEDNLRTLKELLR